MFSRLLVAALMLAIVPPVSANDALKVTQNYPFRVSVDEQGRITGSEPLGEVPLPVRTMVTGLVQGAEFEPARVDSRPVPSRTTLNVRLDYEGDQQHLRVVSTKVTSGGFRSITPPRYPPEAIRRQVGAMVTTTLTYGADGSLDREASRIDSLEMTRDGRPIEKSRHRKNFEAAVWVAVAGWTMLPDEVDGQATAMTTQVPTSFCANTFKSGDCEDWRIRQSQRAREARKAGDEPAGWQAVDAGIQLARLKPTAPAAESTEPP